MYVAIEWVAPLDKVGSLGPRFPGALFAVPTSKAHTSLHRGNVVFRVPVPVPGDAVLIVGTMSVA